MFKLDIEVSYFVYSLIFLFVWAILFLLRRDLRRRMFLFSLVVTPMGPISEIWFLKDYWQRATITGHLISIEDAIFAFAIGGISFSIYAVLFDMTIVPSKSHIAQKRLIILFPVVILSFLLIFTNILGINSIFSSSFSFIFIAVLIWFLRPDLVKPSLATGILILTLFILVYRVMQLIFPAVLTAWCLGCNPSGIRVFGVNVEELLWDFSWGLAGGIIYEAIRGKMFEKRTRRRRPSSLSSYDAFNSKLDESYLKSLSSQYGQFMAVSSRGVLSIRLIRELAYRLSKIADCEVHPNSIILLLPLVPPSVNLLLYPFGLSCQGIAVAWLFHFALLNCCLLWFPQTTWSRLIRISDMVDEMLETEEDKERYINWMKRRLSLRPQIALSVFGGSVGIMAAILFAPLLANTMEFCVASYLSILFTGAFGINAVYWLWVVPFQIRRLYQFPSLRVTWINPARTPGIRAQSQLLGFSAVLSAVGVVLFVTPLLWAYFSVKQDTLLTVTVNSIAFVASLGTVLFIAVSPQYWLSAIVYREKNKILDQLGKEILADYSNSSRLAAGNWQQMESKINIYQVINATSVSTVDVQTLGRYVLAVFTTAIPYLVEWLI